MDKESYPDGHQNGNNGKPERRFCCFQRKLKEIKKAYDSLNFLGCDMTGNVTFVTTYRKPTLELSTVHILPSFYGLKIDF